MQGLQHSGPNRARHPTEFEGTDFPPFEVRDKTLAFSMGMYPNLTTLRCAKPYIPVCASRNEQSLSVGSNTGSCSCAQNTSPSVP